MENQRKGKEKQRLLGKSLRQDEQPVEGCVGCNSSKINNKAEVIAMRVDRQIVSSWDIDGLLVSGHPAPAGSVVPFRGGPRATGA